MAFDDPLPEVSNYTYEPSRGISARVMEMYDVRSYKSDAGEVVKQEYIYPSGGKKIRVMPKTFSAQGLAQDELFGMNLFPAGCAKMVTITEKLRVATSVFQVKEIKK